MMTIIPLLQLAAVTKISTLSRATIYRRMKDGTFPKSIKICENRVAWRYEDINAWLEACAAIGGDHQRSPLCERGAAEIEQWIADRKFQSMAIASTGVTL